MVWKRARVLVVGLAGVLAGSAVMVAGGTATARPSSVPSVPPDPREAAATVTLVTGDVVTLGGPRGVAVRAAQGREHIGFRSHTDPDGDVHVLPQDVVGLVSSGRLDSRLFDVTGLVRAGYDDSRRADLPLIVDYPGAAPRAANVVRELPAMSAFAVRAEKGTGFWLGARATATKVWLDGPVKASLDRSVPQIGAPRAWAAGHTGAGTTVAVLDTGIDVTHPDLAGAVVGAEDFTGSESGTDDRIGHGTHVASIITGSGGRYRGVAPDAVLLNGKVLDDNGEGYESGIIAGMEWAAASGADVVNMSLGSPWSDGTDPMAQALNRLTADTGTLFVAAAGNDGPGAETVGSPGAADAALTVGAVDGEDHLAEFSSRGPRWGDGAIKPDITAPGVGIVAAKAAQGQIGEPAADGYVWLSGTSMAAPHVAGAAAILAGQHPNWTAGTLKSALTATSAPNPELSVFEQGAGRVDVAAAVGTPVVATPASLSLGTTSWPHDDDAPIASTIAYTNTSATPVTLHLTADVDAPPGMFTLSADEVTVPAGGRAEVTLTTDTGVDAADGTYSGVVVATGGETTLRTPVAVAREVESYDVKLTFLDQNGAPTPNYRYSVVDVHTERAFAPYDESGTVVARLPKGDYHVAGYVMTDGAYSTDFFEPAVTVPGPAEYVFDARDGVRPRITVDEPDARSATAVLSGRMTTDWGETSNNLYVPDLAMVLVRPSKTSAPGRFQLVLQSQLARPDSTGERFHESPYLYHVRQRYTSGGVPADLVTHAANRELARVISDHAVGLPGQIGIREGFVSMPLPYTLTEYYTPNEKWYPYFEEATSMGTFPRSSYHDTATPVVYERGGTVRERWNVGVFGPGLPLDPSIPHNRVRREGNVIALSAALFSDQNPRRAGYSEIATGSLSLYRGAEQVGENLDGSHGSFEVPPDRATYTVRATAERQGRLSTKISSMWTFPSAHTDAPVPLPLLAVRFAPDLDDHNAAEAGKLFRFPVYVQRNGVSEPGQVNPPKVEVSYDDGATWARVRLTPRHGRWVAEVDHPADAEFVSLRASVADQNGITAAHTIIRAYALAR